MFLTLYKKIREIKKKNPEKTFKENLEDSFKEKFKKINSKENNEIDNFNENLDMNIRVVEPKELSEKEEKQLKKELKKRSKNKKNKKNKGKLKSLLSPSGKYPLPLELLKLIIIIIVLFYILIMLLSDLYFYDEYSILAKVEVYEEIERVYLSYEREFFHQDSVSFKVEEGDILYFPLNKYPGENFHQMEYPTKEKLSGGRYIEGIVAEISDGIVRINFQDIPVSIQYPYIDNSGHNQVFRIYIKDLLIGSKVNSVKYFGLEFPE